jgi:RNA polymerase sigma-B factor
VHGSERLSDAGPRRAEAVTSTRPSATSPSDTCPARVAQDDGSQRSNEYAHLTPRVVEFASLASGHPRRRALRDELAAKFWPVVVNIARRYKGRGEPVEDLEQAGAVGLLGALERFDPDRGIDFMSFAVPTITGEVRRHFRDRTWAMQVPRRLKDLQAPIRDAVGSLSATLGRAPRPSEIAGWIGVSVDDVVEALAAYHCYSPASLDALVSHDGGETVLGDLLGLVDAEFATVEHRRALQQALAELPERERRIVALRFFEDHTQSQIAAQVGVSQMHVSRLLSQSLAFLRARLEST